MFRWFSAVLVAALFWPMGAEAKVFLRPAPQLWVYAAKLDLEGAKKLVAEHQLDEQTLGRALFHSLRRLKPADSKKYAETLQFLLDSGADPNYAPPSGLTPLMLASLKGEPVLTRILLEMGADVAAGDGQGRTATDYLALSAADAKAKESVRALLANPPAAKVAGKAKSTPKAAPAAKEAPKEKPVISNLGADDLGDKLVFTFDLTAAEPACVKLIGSLDGGKTYGMKFSGATGDLGKGVEGGANKKIVWSIKKDYPSGLTSVDLVMDVVAETCP